MDTNRIDQDWQKYFDAKASRIRKNLHVKLDARIDHIESLTPADQDAYIDAMISATTNGMKKLPLGDPRILKHVKRRITARMANPDADTLLQAYLLMRYPGIYQIAKVNNSVELLEKALAFDPDHRLAATHLYDARLNTMDFALHELPTGLLIDENCGEKVIEKANRLAERFPFLLERKSRFGCTMDDYANLFHLWLDYDGKQQPRRFEEWPAIRMAYFDNRE